MPDVKSIDKIRQSISTVPWDRLAHAYHAAWDAPENLEIFLNLDVSKDMLDGALDWLWGSVLHQGSIYSASTPVLWILIDLIATHPQHAAASSILYAIQTITDSLSYAAGTEKEEVSIKPVQQNLPGNPVYEVWVHNALSASMTTSAEKSDYFKACLVTKRQLRSLIRHAMPTIADCLQSLDRSTRSASVAAALGVVQAMPDEAQRFLGLVEAIGNPDYDPGDWMSISAVLGHRRDDMAQLLNHADPRVRLSAAMSDSTKDLPQSVQELASALANLEWLETAFPNNMAHLDMHLRFYVLETLLERVSPERAETFVIEAICTLIREKAGVYSVDFGWGSVLHWAFHERLVNLRDIKQPDSLPATLSPTQAAILHTLCAKDELWSRRNGNARLAYSRIQLPYDRKVIHSLLERTEA